MREKPKKRWVKILLIVIAILVLIVGTYVFTVYTNAKKTVGEMHDPVESIDVEEGKLKLKDSALLNILLLGIDAEEGESGRSDALMILSLDPTSNQMQLVSIPRDTRVAIVGKGIDDKINHAYAFGGSDMAVATVEGFLDIDLDYYVSINMDGFEELVDQLGSITVFNDIAWSEGGYDFGFGPTEMDGEQTMHFVRMRKKDPEGDLGRNKRQRQVIQGIVNEGASVTSITKVHGLIDVLGNNMATNLDFDDMKSLLSNYKNTRKNFKDYQMNGIGKMIDGIYYLIVDEEETKKVREMIIDI